MRVAFFSPLPPERSGIEANRGIGPQRSAVLIDPSGRAVHDVGFRVR